MYYIKKIFQKGFWDIQPVSRDIKLIEGIIKKPKEIYSNSKINDFTWDIIKNNIAFYNFILSNYTRNEHYSIEYLNWILNNSNDSNICLLKDNKLIGTIIGKPMMLFVNSKIINIYYVDFLCIDKKYRNNNLAPKLMYKLIDVWKNNNLNAMIFKKDEIPLDFNYITEYNYYYYIINKNPYSTQNIKLIKLTNEFIYEAYNFFNDYVKKYATIYQLFSLNEFIYNFISNSFIDTYITFNDKMKITSFINIHKMNYFYNKKNLKGIELKYYLCLDENLIYNVLNNYLNIDIFIFTDLFLNYKLINLLSPIKGHKTYIHFYNYHSIIDKQLILL